MLIRIREMLPHTLAMFVFSTSVLAAGNETADTHVRLVDSDVGKSTIEIYSNGNFYEVSNSAELSTVLDVSIQPTKKGGIKEWTARVETRRVNQDWQEHVSSSQSRRYPLGHRPSQINVEARLLTDFSLEGALYCNAMAERLRIKGLSNKDIFSRDRVIEIGVRPILSYKLEHVSGSLIAPASRTQADQADQSDKQSLDNAILICKAAESEAVARSFVPKLFGSG